MTFLDATAPELAAASAIGEVEPDEALRSFLNRFNVNLVSDRLGESSYIPVDEPEPSYFRYLVLTSAIASNDIAGVDATTNNFRVRLGQALGVSELHSVRGVNPLWRKLATWSEKQRARGLPVREVVLPDPGSMNLIGYAVRMAFPAWRERAQFTAILKGVHPSVRRSPSRLVNELTRAHRSPRIPTAIASAMDDFAVRLRSGQTMLWGHRFWSLVTSIEASLLAEEGTYRMSSPIIEMTFGGYEQDEPQFRVCDSRIRPEEESFPADMSWADIARSVSVGSKGRPTLGLRQGFAIFKKSAGCWTCDDEGIDANDRCRIIARGNSVARLWRLDASWAGLDEQWSISGHVSGADIQRCLGKDPTFNRELDRPRLEGGIRLKHNVYLGRPGFLPTVEQLNSGRLTIERLVGSGDLSAERSGDLTTKAPLDGIWRIEVNDPGNRTDLSVAFERNSPEPLAFRTSPVSDKWLLEKELADTAALNDRASFSKPRSTSQGRGSVELEGLCEAVFSKAHTGWREGELLELLSVAVPSRHLIWDVLRSFQEGGWLDAYVARAWKSRMWVCRSPRLVRLTDNHAVADGALGAVLVARLADCARPLGVDLRSERGLGDLSPMTIHLKGDRLVELAEALKWPITKLDGLPSSDANRQWPDDDRTPDGRSLASVWSHSVGLFLERATDSVDYKVERWVRERGDEADLFVIRNGNAVVRKTSSRMIAILEGHRRNRIPLFASRGDNVIRLKKSGYLPLPIARQLRFRSGSASGPFGPVGGNWIYTYSTDRETCGWLRSFLQHSLVSDGTDGDPMARLVKWRHRKGRRPGWNELISG